MEVPLVIYFVDRTVIVRASQSLIKGEEQKG